MCNRFFDYDDGDFAMSISDNMAMDSDGDLMMRMGDHMAMDMDTGDIHMISSWPDAGSCTRRCPGSVYILMIFFWISSGSSDR